MKVGTLTFHSADNLGAMLQAYALPEAVKALGHDCEIIDYRCPAVTSAADLEWPDELIRRYGILKGCVKAVNRWRLGWFDRRKRNVKFAAFMRKMPKSQKTYRSIQKMTDLRYDAILFGSDQIWNPRITKGLDDVYFGGFPGAEGTKKVAYAASNGGSSADEEVLRRLQGFHALSVREKGLAEFLRGQGLPAEHVLDPVLLLTKEQWRRVEAPLPKGIVPGKYLLVYGFNEEQTYALARKIAKEEKLLMVLVRWGREDSRYPDMLQLPMCGPRELVTLVDKAALVCTGSFHGTALSILFGKRFYCGTPEFGASRIESILNSLGLGDRWVRSEQLPEKEVDYAPVEEKLEALRKESLAFLKDAIEK